MERKFYFYIAIVFTSIVTVGSLISLDSVVKLPQVNFMDKILHASAYFVLATSWFLAFYKGFKRKFLLLKIVIALFIYGIIIEVLQGVFTTYRQADLFDVLANSIGILIAWAFFKRISVKK